MLAVRGGMVGLRSGYRCSSDPAIDRVGMYLDPESSWGCVLQTTCALRRLSICRQLLSYHILKRRGESYTTRNENPPDHLPTRRCNPRHANRNGRIDPQRLINNSVHIRKRRTKAIDLLRPLELPPNLPFQLLINVRRATQPISHSTQNSSRGLTARHDERITMRRHLPIRDAQLLPLLEDIRAEIPALQCPALLLLHALQDLGLRLPQVRDAPPRDLRRDQVRHEAVQERLEPVDGYVVGVEFDRLQDYRDPVVGFPLAHGAEWLAECELAEDCLVVIH